MILIGHGSSITQCKIEGDNLIILSDKEEDHYNDVWSLLNLPNNHFASGYQNGIIKIWWVFELMSYYIIYYYLFE